MKLSHHHRAKFSCLVTHFSSSLSRTFFFLIQTAPSASFSSSRSNLSFPFVPVGRAVSPLFCVTLFPPCATSLFPALLLFSASVKRRSVTQLHQGYWGLERTKSVFKPRPFLYLFIFSRDRAQLGRTYHLLRVVWALSVGVHSLACACL